MNLSLQRLDKFSDLDKENYGSASVAPCLSLIFERIMCYQINNFMAENYESNYHVLERTIRITV